MTTGEPLLGPRLTPNDVRDAVTNVEVDLARCHELVALLGDSADDPDVLTPARNALDRAVAVTTALEALVAELEAEATWPPETDVPPPT
jgi:hypothetical protein